MNESMISWLIILEITLPLLLLSVILGWILYANHRKTKEAARGLILKIKNNEPNERNALLSFLTTKVAMPEEVAKKKVRKILNERKFLFRNLISGILDKDVAALAALEADMSRITDHYHELELSGKLAEETLPEEDELVFDEPEEDIDELKQEIKSLKHEVHITLTTLNNIFSEFSSMFGEEQSNGQLTVDQIITAMEAFANKSGATDNASDETADEKSTIENDESTSGVESDEKDQGDLKVAKEAEPTETAIDEADNKIDESENEETAVETNGEAALDFGLDQELDDIDSVLDDLELGSSGDDEPSWDEAFEESGDKTDKE